MMQMMRTVRFVLVVAGVLMAGGLAGAQRPGGAGAGPGFAQHTPPMERAFGFEGARGQWWNNPRMVTQLKLTDDQRKAMDGILQDHRMKLIDLRANLEKAEVTMQPLINADEPNETEILAAIDKVAQARAELEKANARFLLELRAKLTPDQWKQLQTMHQDRMEHERMRDWGRGQWGHDGRGPGMGGPGQFRGQGGQFHRPPAAPQGAPAPAPGAAPAPAPAPGTGEEQ